SSICSILMITARLFKILYVISCTSLYDFGTYKTTLEVVCCIDDKLTTLFCLDCFCSNLVGCSVCFFTSSTYSYSYSSSVLKKFLNLSLKLIIITSNRC